ncbi:MAG: hypothetical protein U5K69_22370 [Balneolaceae bacterium]|nr:hypothetical protein [Balneolaceae bacterium]
MKSQGAGKLASPKSRKSLQSVWVKASGSQKAVCSGRPENENIWDFMAGFLVRFLPVQKMNTLTSGTNYSLPMGQVAGMHAQMHRYLDKEKKPCTKLTGKINDPIV